MNEKDRLEEHLLYLKADKWLGKNGEFMRTILEKDYEIGFKLSFKMEGDDEPTVRTGTDLINLTINLHADVS
jgi:hypothetical protein